MTKIIRKLWAIFDDETEDIEIVEEGSLGIGQPVVPEGTPSGNRVTHSQHAEIIDRPRIESSPEDIFAKTYDSLSGDEAQQFHDAWTQVTDMGDQIDLISSFVDWVDAPVDWYVGASKKRAELEIGDHAWSKEYDREVEIIGGGLLEGYYQIALPNGEVGEAKIEDLAVEAGVKKADGRLEMWSDENLESAITDLEAKWLDSGMYEEEGYPLTQAISDVATTWSISPEELEAEYRKRHPDAKAYAAKAFRSSKK